MKRTFYIFNSETLSFEKAKHSVKEIIKRLLWLLLTALSFALAFVWIFFYAIDSPKEKMLQKENNELKKQISQLDHKLNKMDIILTDIQNRDDNVYRTIFEAEPIPYEARNPSFTYNSKYDNITASESKKFLENLDLRSDKLILRMATEMRSLDSVKEMAVHKAEMLSAIPAIRPIKNMYHITSGFGRRYHPILKTLRPHTGIDISAPKGTPVYATADGTISNEQGGSGYGITVIIRHGYSYSTVYAHLSKKIVKSGQRVKRGQLIGYVGNTGLSMGTHLHYEVRKNGTPVNPVHFFFSDITPEEYNQILESSKDINQALS